MDRIVRTVLGDIPANEIGVTDAHDHLIRSGGPEIKIDINFLMDDVEAGKKEFERFLNAGGKTMVCMDPIGCGRNVPKMLEIAKAYQDRGNIIMTTGFQKGSNYDPRTSFLATVSIEKIAEMMALEIEEGMDIHSYNGPVVERSKAKAGLIKAGTSYRLITRIEEKAIKIAALTQQMTGCPISFHTDFGTMGLEIIKLLRENGADLTHTVLCHVQRNPDRRYYERLLDTGINLCFEESNKAQYRPDTEIAGNIAWLIEKGYASQILLGVDGGRKEALASYMEPQGIAYGLEYMLTDFVPTLEYCGASTEAIKTILEKNPSRVLSIWK